MSGLATQAQIAPQGIGRDDEHRKVSNVFAFGARRYRTCRAALTQRRFKPSFAPRYPPHPPHIRRTSPSHRRNRSNPVVGAQPWACPSCLIKNIWEINQRRRTTHIPCRQGPLTVCAYLRRMRGGCAEYLRDIWRRSVRLQSSIRHRCPAIRPSGLAHCLALPPLGHPGGPNRNARAAFATRFGSNREREPHIKRGEIAPAPSPRIV